jgi:MoaA/NifB/PqqE/SkfB family radical SAM enzyme
MSSYHQNLALFKADLRERRIVFRSMPIWLGLVLTTRCNLRCIMCTRVLKKGELPPSLMDKVRPLYPTLARMEWQGGEVFVVDYFREMFEEASRYSHIAHLVITAGTLIDEEWARLFARSNVILMFSIDSAVPENYRRIRKGTELSRVTQSFALLDRAERSAGRRVARRMCVTLMKENARDVLSLVPFAHEHGVLTIDVTARVPLDDDVSLFNPAGVGRNREDLCRLKSDLSLARDQARLVGVRLVDRVSPVIDALLCDDKPLSREGEPRGDWDCYTPWRGLMVQAEHHDGDILPDCQCYLTPIGNIHRDDLTEAWNNSAMQEYRRRILEKRVQGWCNPDCTSPGINPAHWFKPDYDFSHDRVAEPRLLFRGSKNPASLKTAPENLSPSSL